MIFMFNTDNRPVHKLEVCISLTVDSYWFEQQYPDLILKFCHGIKCFQLFKKPPHILFFFLLFIPMRSYGGGLHMKTYFACFIGSCFILTSSLLAVKYLTIPLPISFALYLFASILILVIGPVDHPNREVDAQENRTFIKRTYFTMLISFLLALFFIFTQNTRYMFLQAIVFVFISATSLIGRLIYKQT